MTSVSSTRSSCSHCCTLLIPLLLPPAASSPMTAPALLMLLVLRPLPLAGRHPRARPALMAAAARLAVMPAPGSGCDVALAVGSCWCWPRCCTVLPLLLLLIQLIHLHQKVHQRVVKPVQG